MLLDNIIIEASLQLMLNTIINHHFKNARCIIRMVAFPNSPYHHLSLSSLNITVPQIVDPLSCVRDCDHYIDDDPLLTRSYDLLTCFKRNKEYTFKGIIFLEYGRIDDYKPEAFGAHNLQIPIYAGNAIFIQRIGDEFVISAFTNWFLKEYVVLNRWNIYKQQFVDENIDEFFSDKRKRRIGGVLNIGVSTDIAIPIAIACISCF